LFFSLLPQPPISPPFPYTTLFRSTRQCAPNPHYAPCIFEHVYLARSDSLMDGVSVYKARLRMGEKLADKILRERPEHDIDVVIRSEEHTSELQSRENLVCRLLLEK